MSPVLPAGAISTRCPQFVHTLFSETSCSRVRRPLSMTPSDTVIRHYRRINGLPAVLPATFPETCSA
jgi:hypothetical protein